MRKFALLAIAAASLAACGPITRTTQLVTQPGVTQTAYPGDTVMQFKSTKQLRTPFGGADPWGRTTFAGGLILRYLGSQGDAAYFDGAKTAVETDASTLTETPLLLPSVETAQVDATVNGQPVTATITQRGTTYIPPRPSKSWVTDVKTTSFTLKAGQSRTEEGRRLTVLRVGPNFIEYRVD